MGMEESTCISIHIVLLAKIFETEIIVYWYVDLPSRKFHINDWAFILLCLNWTRFAKIHRKTGQWTLSFVFYGFSPISKWRLGVEKKRAEQFHFTQAHGERARSLAIQNF